MAGNFLMDSRLRSSSSSSFFGGGVFGYGREEAEVVRWVKHYSSYQQILLVGEGDFSFSTSLATSFGSASNMVATSLDPQDVVIKKYGKAKSNLDNLKRLGAMVLHGIDATKMKLNKDLKMRKFDRIIFNFPHAGFYGKEDKPHIIRLHKRLVQGFFKNASQMLRPYGEIHVSHKTTGPYLHWKLEELAEKCSLALIDCVEFDKKDYPGYMNKRGDGISCDDPFRLGESSTYKFIVRDPYKEKFISKPICDWKISIRPIPEFQSNQPSVVATHSPVKLGYSRIYQGNPEFCYGSSRVYGRDDGLCRFSFSRDLHELHQIPEFQFNRQSAAATYSVVNLGDSHIHRDIPETFENLRLYGMHDRLCSIPHPRDRYELHLVNSLRSARRRREKLQKMLLDHGNGF